MHQDNELKSLKDLANLNFFIPNYQRAYRWGRGEINTLLEDVWDFAQIKQDGFYCLQPIVVKKSDKKYNVIDGQQRLTTIFLIIKYLNSKDLFKLEYQTRLDSTEFLKNIQNRLNERGKNIDFFHLANAYETISNFFAQINIDDRNNFIDTFLNDCKVLWYEAQEKENDVFIRLNIGKIPLLEAENVKALFLSRNDNLDDDDIKLRAEFWYESEIQARANRDFRYCVLSKITPNDIFKDEYNKPALRDDIARIEAYLKAIVPYKKTKHYLFDYFYKSYKEQSLNEKWDELHSTIQTLGSFASGQGGKIIDRQIFHYIGFLTLASYSIFDIYKKWIEVQDNEKFSNELLGYIKSHIRNFINDIEMLSYTEKKDRNKISLLLLLFNLEYMIQDESSNKYFEFNRFVLEQWSLEHIYAQNSKSIFKMIKDKNNEKIVDWLKEVLLYIKNDDIKTKIENTIKNKDFDPSLFDDIDENFKSDETLNSISNLTLLDKESNSRLANLIFSEKHKEIEILGRQDKLIPIMTRKVFAKDIEGLDYSHKDFFGDDDRKAYFDYINKLLIRYKGVNNES